MIFNNDSQNDEKQIVRKEISTIGGNKRRMGESTPSESPGGVPKSYANVVRSNTTSETKDLRRKRVQFKFDKTNDNNRV